MVLIEQEHLNYIINQAILKHLYLITIPATKYQSEIWHLPKSDFHEAWSRNVLNWKITNFDIN
jgi:hypothetical protein